MKNLIFISINHLNRFFPSKCCYSRPRTISSYQFVWGSNTRKVSVMQVEKRLFRCCCFFSVFFLAKLGKKCTKHIFSLKWWKTIIEKLFLYLNPIEIAKLKNWQCQLRSAKYDGGELPCQVIGRGCVADGAGWASTDQALEWWGWWDRTGASCRTTRSPGCRLWKRNSRVKCISWRLIGERGIYHSTSCKLREQELACCQRNHGPWDSALTLQNKGCKSDFWGVFKIFRRRT